MAVIAALAMFLAINALVVVVFAHLWRVERAPHLRWWAAAFAVLFGAELAGGSELLGLALAPLQALGLPLIVTSTLLLLRGTASLLGRAWRHGWTLGGLGAFLVGVAAISLGVKPTLAATPAMSFLAAAYLAMGIAVWRSVARPRGLGAGLTLVASVSSAAHLLDFPFLSDVPAFVPWGVAIASFNEVAVAIGLLMLHSERSRAERAQAEARYHELADTVGVGLLEVSADGKLVAASPALVRLLGYASEQELLAADPRALEHESTGAKLGELGARDAMAVGVELRWRTKTGRVLALQLHGQPLKDRHGRRTGLRGFVVDHTAALELEQRALHQQKLEVVGQLAGGVAHDFNNLLTVIQSAQHLLAPLATSDEQRAVLQDATEAATQAAQLTRRLLAFGRKQPFYAQVFDVGAVVRRTASMLGRTLGPAHRLDLSGVQAGLHARMDPGHLEQVVVNLVLNARDAMPDGAITLTVAPAARPEGGVELAVSDSGRGMDDAERARLFEPFFTTKGSGRGSGLGLATVQGIVQQAGGGITVESTKGKGSRFTVWLPTVDAPERTAARAEATRLDGLRVLVADDEPALLRTVVRLLEGEGCVVTAVASGAELVERVERGERFDLVLSDVRMPGVDGIEAARALRARAPELPIVLMSGFTDRLDEAEAQL
ncbi:MAG: ATP-binding protein, partial [Myxococcota bacterium]